MTRLKLSLMLGLATLGVAAAQTSPTSPIQITASTSLVTTVTVDGKTTEKLSPAPTALPGQTLELSQKVVNVSKGKVGNLKLSQLIPAAALYQSNSCDLPGVKALFSADPVKSDPKTGAVNATTMQFSDRPMKTVVVKENGADVKKMVAATPADYTALRWVMPDLSAGQSANCALRVKVR